MKLFRPKSFTFQEFSPPCFGALLHFHNVITTDFFYKFYEMFVSRQKWCQCSMHALSLQQFIGCMLYFDQNVPWYTETSVSKLVKASTSGYSRSGVVIVNNSFTSFDNRSVKTWILTPVNSCRFHYFINRDCIVIQTVQDIRIHSFPIRISSILSQPYGSEPPLQLYCSRHVLIFGFGEYSNVKNI